VTGWLACPVDRLGNLEVNPLAMRTFRVNVFGIALGKIICGGERANGRCIMPGAWVYNATI